MSYLKGLGNSVQSQGGFKKWPISDVDPLLKKTLSSDRFGPIEHLEAPPVT